MVIDFFMVDAGIALSAPGGFYPLYICNHAIDIDSLKSLKCIATWHHNGMMARYVGALYLLYKN